MWAVEYSREVRNYIYDSYPYTDAVWQAIKSLRQTKEGIPAEGVTQLEPGVCLWEVVNHLVVYERDVERQTLIVTVVKPVEEE